MKQDCTLSTLGEMKQRNAEWFPQTYIQDACGRDRACRRRFVERIPEANYSEPSACWAGAREGASEIGPPTD